MKNINFLSKVLNLTSLSLMVILGVSIISGLIINLLPISIIGVIGIIFSICFLIGFIGGVYFYQNMNLKQSKIFFWIINSMFGILLGFIIIKFSIVILLSALLFTSVLFYSIKYLVEKGDINFLKFGNILLCGLIIGILFSLINILIGSSLLHIIITLLVFFIFVGYIGYDIQRILESPEQVIDEKIIYLESLNMNLNIINLFIKVLEILSWFDLD